MRAHWSLQLQLLDALEVFIAFLQHLWFAWHVVRSNNDLFSCSVLKYRLFMFIVLNIYAVLTLWECPSLNPQVAAGVKFNKTNSFDLTGCIIGKFVWSLLVQLIAALGSHDTAQRGLHRCWVIPLFFCGTFISSCVFIRDKAKRSRGQSRNCLKWARPRAQTTKKLSTVVSQIQA